MNEILKMLNELKADELDSLIVRAKILLEKKRKEEAEQALLEKERLRQEKIEQEKRRQQEIAELQRKLQELQSQKPDIPEPVNGDNFVMREPAAPVQRLFADPSGRAHQHDDLAERERAAADEERSDRSGLLLQPGRKKSAGAGDDAPVPGAGVPAGGAGKPYI